MKKGVAYMPVPRCDQCKYWEAYPLNAYSRPVGDCLVVGIYTEHGRLNLGTSEDFGCVRWEAADVKCKICGEIRRKGKGKYCNPYCRHLARERHLC